MNHMIDWFPLNLWPATQPSFRQVLCKTISKYIRWALPVCVTQCRTLELIPVTYNFAIQSQTLSNNYTAFSSLMQIYDYIPPKRVVYVNINIMTPTTGLTLLYMQQKSALSPKIGYSTSYNFQNYYVRHLNNRSRLLEGINYLLLTLLWFCFILCNQKEMIFA